MKKIGIVTLLGYFNYGNRLQNYALQEIIKSFGYEVESLIFDDKPFLTELQDNRSFVQKLGTLTPTKLLKILINLSRKQKNKKRLQNIQSNREEKFLNFSKNFILEKKYDPNDNYEAFIVGSDQVWNPNYILNKPQYLLMFADPEKRISYAASIGISELPIEAKSIYKKELEMFRHISVREDVGAKIVRDLIGNTPPVVLDPTLLLSKQQWLNIANRASNRPNKKYILTYFLGELPSKATKIIDFLQQRSDFDIINLAQMSEVETYETSPSEFLDYFEHTDFVLTDSFHAVAFSIIFEKDFVAFKREGTHDMSSRMDTILNLTELTSRKASQVDMNQLQGINFNNAKNKLEIAKRNSLKYLEEALKEIN